MELHRFVRFAGANIKVSRRERKRVICSCLLRRHVRNGGQEGLFRADRDRGNLKLTYVGAGLSLQPRNNLRSETNGLNQCCIQCRRYNSAGTAHDETGIRLVHRYDPPIRFNLGEARVSGKQHRASGLDRILTPASGPRAALTRYSNNSNLHGVHVGNSYADQLRYARIPFVAIFQLFIFAAGRELI